MVVVVVEICIDPDLLFSLGVLALTATGCFSRDRCLDSRRRGLWWVWVWACACAMDSESDCMVVAAGDDEPRLVSLEPPSFFASVRDTFASRASLAVGSMGEG